MRPTERMALLEKIGTELQRQYTFADIEVFLNAAKVRWDRETEWGGSKRVFAKLALANAPDDDLLKLASELEIAAADGGAGPVMVTPPSHWRDTKEFRLFISHISADKLKATKLKQALAKYEIAGFVAHEDIEPTLEWQVEIERGLQTMDALVAVCTKGFSLSNWTQQEIGFALGRNIKVIAFEMGEIPTGFISKHQAIRRQNRTADEIAAEIDKLLSNDPRTAEKLSAAKAAFWDKPDVPF